MSATPYEEGAAPSARRDQGETPPATARRPGGIDLAIQTVLVVLAFLYALQVAQAFLLPIVLAVLLSFLLRPIVRGLRRVHVPAPVGAALVLVAIVCAGLLTVERLSDPAAEWLARAPRTFRDLSRRMKEVMKPVEQASQAAAEAEKITEVISDTDTPKVAIQDPSLSDTVLSGMWELVLGAIVTLTLLYFLLASGDILLAKLVRVYPRLSKKKDVVEVVRGVERGVSLYLLTQATINACLGVAVGGVLWWLGIPNPALWGVLAGLLNFVPYLGAWTMAAILTLVAAATFQQLIQVAAVVATFFVLTAVEGLLISPLVVGKRLALNSLAVFLSVIFWGWMWGIAGALIAVPLLATVKIVSDQVQSLSKVSEFLSS